MISEIIKISLPVVVAQLSFALMSFIDTLLMGLLGVEVIAGGGLGAVVFQFFYVVGIGVLVATANLIAFAKGRENDDEIRKALLSGCVVVVLLSIIFISLLLHIRPLLILLGQEVETVNYACRYLKVVSWALFPAFGFILIRSLVLGMGSPSAILPICIVSAAINYPVSYVLMVGLFGIEPMGIEGIALGTCVISWGMFLGLVVLVYRQELFKPYVFWKGWDRFSVRQFVETVRLGIPISLAHAMEIGMFSAAALLMGLLGVNALASHQVALQLTSLSFMIPLGISQAVSVKVGELYGALAIAKISIALRSGLILALLGSCLSASLFLFAPEFLVTIFIKESLVGAQNYQSVLAISVGILFVAALFQFVDGVQVVLMGALRGLKLGFLPTAASVFSYWGIGIPCAYLFMASMGAQGVWFGMGLGLGSSSLMLAVIFWREIRKQRLSA
mgnify:CR=1 FL=1